LVAGVGFEPHDLRVMRTSLKYEQMKERQEVCDPKLAFGDNLATSGLGTSFSKFLTEDQPCGGESPQKLGSSRNVRGQTGEKMGRNSRSQKSDFGSSPHFPAFLERNVYGKKENMQNQYTSQ